MSRAKRLFLLIEVSDFPNVEALVDQADEYYDGEIHDLLVEEWVYSDMGLTFVTLPGEKCMNNEYTVLGLTGRLHGALVATRAPDLAPRSVPGGKPE